MASEPVGQMHDIHNGKVNYVEETYHTQVHASTVCHKQHRLTHFYTHMVEMLILTPTILQACT